jgi:hypothetical protein
VTAEIYTTRNIPHLRGYNSVIQYSVESRRSNSISSKKIGANEITKITFQHGCSDGKDETGHP